MDGENTINLLDNSLDEASQKYIQEALENWKESVSNQLIEQMEEVKAAKIEELEEENQKYREQLREEYADKMMAGLSDLKEKMKAEITAKVVKDNPELKILEQIKEAVAPLLNEEYRDVTYSNSLAALSEEVEELRREKALAEGKETLTDLLAPYSDKTKRMVSALIKEGTSDEVTENFYNSLKKKTKMRMMTKKIMKTTTRTTTKAKTTKMATKMTKKMIKRKKVKKLKKMTKIKLILNQ